MKNNGALYFGTRNVTISGRVCQSWTSNEPHKISEEIMDDQFPDNSRAEAKNFCRNPLTYKMDVAWCYTTDPLVEWENCFNCTEQPTDYQGMAPLPYNPIIIHLFVNFAPYTGG